MSDIKVTDAIHAATVQRAGIKTVAEDVHGMLGSGALPGEASANIMLAYRHLEDASMRLGKVIQALDGGASVYDRATTVGAD